MGLYRAILIGYVLCILSGCAVHPKIYNKLQPELQLQNYFNGATTGYGVVQNWRGEVIRRFVVTMEGKQDGDKFVLSESFVYDDGEQQQREWQFAILDRHNFTGQAPDVVGNAVGAQYGNSIKMGYALKLMVSGRPLVINFEDWLYMVDSKAVINKAKMKKLGFTVGYLTVSFVK